MSQNLFSKRSSCQSTEYAKKSRKSQENQRLVCAELCIVIEAYEVFVREEMVDLTPRETEVLYYLAKNAGRVLTRNQIMNCVWGYDYCGDTRAVDNQIKRIRQKLPADGVHFEIKAVYGVGYKFELPYKITLQPFFCHNSRL